MDFKICDVIACQTVISPKDCKRVTVGSRQRELCPDCAAKLEAWIQETFLQSHSQAQPSKFDLAIDILKNQEIVFGQDVKEIAMVSGIATSGLNFGSFITPEIVLPEDES